MDYLKSAGNRLYVALRDNDLERAHKMLDDPDALDIVLHLAHALAPHDIGGSHVRHSLADIIEEREGAAMGRAMLDRALGRDVTLDVRPGALRPGDAVRDYVAGMVDDLRPRRDTLAASKLDDIIERNAPGWQEGESDAERARRLA